MTPLRGSAKELDSCAADWVYYRRQLPTAGPLPVGAQPSTPDRFSDDRRVELLLRHRAVRPVASDQPYWLSLDFDDFRAESVAERSMGFIPPGTTKALGACHHPRLPGPPEIEIAALAHHEKAGNERAFGQRHSQSTGDLCTTTSWGFFARRNDKAGTGVTAP